MKPLLVLLLLLSSLLIEDVSAQPSFEEQWAYPYNANYSALSLKADRLNRPYVYVASNEGGLIILSSDGEWVTQISTEELGSEVMNVEQDEELLFLSLGGHFLGDDPPGIGTIDISDPENPVILQVWEYETTEESNGMGIVVSEGDLLFAGAMGLGLLILDRKNPSDLKLLSRLPLDINYPHPNPSNPNLYNARGIHVIGDLAYVSYDSGGLRIIDVSDPENPAQIGQYANPITFANGNRPRAYNNVLVLDEVAYLAVDYCGVEALDVSDPSDIKLLDHYNPVDCPDGSWYNAAVHTNELVADESCDQLFLTAAKSDLIAVDISDPTDLKLNGSFGTTQDTMATWGLDRLNNDIYLGYLIIPIYIPFIHPFDAKWSGVRKIEVDQECVPNSVDNELLLSSLEIFPNPSMDKITIHSIDTGERYSVSLYDGSSRSYFEGILLSGESLVLELPNEGGVYFLQLRSRNHTYVEKVFRIPR